MRLLLTVSEPPLSVAIPVPPSDPKPTVKPLNPPIVATPPVCVNAPGIVPSEPMAIPPAEIVPAERVKVDCLPLLLATEMPLVLSSPPVWLNVPCCPKELTLPTIVLEGEQVPPDKL